MQFSPFPAPSPSCSAPPSAVQFGPAAPLTASSAAWWSAAGRRACSQICCPATLPFLDWWSRRPLLSAVPHGAQRPLALHGVGSPAMAVWAGPQRKQGSCSVALQRRCGMRCLTCAVLPTGAEQIWRLYMRKIKPALGSRSAESLGGYYRYSIKQLNLIQAPGSLIYKQQGPDPSTVNYCNSNFISCSIFSTPRALLHYHTPLTPPSALYLPALYIYMSFPSPALSRVVNISAGKGSPPRRGGFRSSCKVTIW